MRIMICIDDTDNLDSQGTGELSQQIAFAIEEKGWGKCSQVTRHQLLVHPDIPYTSHNSAMCFAADLVGEELSSVIEFAAGFLTRESAEGADPGLCVIPVDQIEDTAKLIAFGWLAKQKVLTKEEAYLLAKELGIHLSEHGGTGQGVIGALAGVGLRLSGMDGRFKGKIKVESIGPMIAVKELLRHEGIDEVRSLDGQVLESFHQVKLGDKVKTVLLDNKAVLLVAPFEGANWQTCSKQQLKEY